MPIDAPFLPTQLPFDLGARAAYGREDFFVSGCNAEAVAWLDRWPDWPAPMLILQGAAGAGKTHLSHVFKERLQGRALIWDDVDLALAGADGAAVAQDIFYAYNRYDSSAAAPLLLTARTSPTAWRVELADLRSRIMAAPCVALLPPDDALMAVVMAKLFADRQLAVAPDVTAYLLRRIGRSFADIGRVVAALDQAALAQRRAITVPFAKNVLDGMKSDSLGDDVGQ